MIPDACPECDPFDSPASLPDSRGVHECRAGHRWRTTRDMHGWPIVRTTWRYEAELRDTRSAGWPGTRRAA